MLRSGSGSVGQAFRRLGRGARAMRRGSPPARRSHELSGGGCRPVPEPSAGIAAVERGIEQFRERRPDRLNVRPVRALDFGVFDFLGNFGSLRHDRNMGLRRAAEKAGIVNPPCRSAANAGAGTAANR
jgi:hypothetical protein